MTTEKRITQVREIDKELTELARILELLQWDQEIQMPIKGVEQRAEQIECISALIHKRYCSDVLAEHLAVLGADKESPPSNFSFSEQDWSLLQVLGREQRRKRRLPEALVRRLAREKALAFTVWKEAREKQNFDVFSSVLKTLVELTREYAGYIGYKHEPYDALLNEYEPDISTEQVELLFQELEEVLKEIIANTEEQKQFVSSLLDYKVPQEIQEAFHKILLRKLGFDFQRGRFDQSIHPFTCTLGSHDVRITTRYRKYMEAFFSTLHEFGHALYELQISPQWYGTSVAEGTNLSIHESQSRLWENIIGRSRAFWEYWYPSLQDHYQGPLKNTSLKDFLHNINKIQRGNIRVEADEVTYNLHIILRFRMERLLIQGKLMAKDASEYWNHYSKELLGVVPRNDLEGVLQDIHWAHASFGYFPTYALGNLCSAQIYHGMRQDIPNLMSDLQQGHYENIVRWLATHIHAYGKSKSTNEILESISGESLTAHYYNKYLIERYRTSE